MQAMDLFRPIAPVRYSNNMMIMLSLLGVSVLLELILLYTPAWQARRLLSVPVFCTSGFAAGFVALYAPISVFSIVVGLLYVYRAGNVIRIIEQRMHEKYLRQAVRRTSRWLMGMQLGAGLCWGLWLFIGIPPAVLWAAVAVLQLGVAALLLVTMLHRMRRTAWPAATEHYSDAELPTLTVAIPARNETEDLQQCLETLVACNYPKLEIIVLDDCSQTRRTPEIIRGFAHNGVRFIKGSEPDGIWLPKNRAYDRLATEATGAYILFCGVDIRFTPLALKEIVGTVLARKKRMMSILPERAPAVRSGHALAQVMRYMWELVPPRRLFRRPPVLSSCWIIEKAALQEAGQFNAVRRSIVPEAHFARFAAVTDAYSFMRAGVNPGVQSTKGALEQRNTAVRMRYPQLHRRPENVVLLAAAEVGFILLPFVILVTGYWLGVGSVAILLAAATVAFLLVMYTVVALSTKLGNGLMTVMMLPVVVAYDLLLLHYSMAQYEFSEVDWKGRNVCVPAMHVIPHLPKV